MPELAESPLHRPVLHCRALEAGHKVQQPLALAERALTFCRSGSTALAGSSFHPHKRGGSSSVPRLYLRDDLAGFIGLASDGSARGCPLQSAVAGDITVRCLTTSHGVRTGFPVHFLAAPMETFLETPVFHPNIYPETGFVCLRVQHRVSDTVRPGLDKLAAKLSGHLENTATLHVMRPAAREHPMPAGAVPLLSVPYVSARGSDPTVPGGRRLRRQ